MAGAYITEFEALAVDGQNGASPHLLTPAIAAQNIAIGAVTPSAPFGATTKFVRIDVDAICSIKFGAAPVAAVTDLRLPANGSITVGVVPGQKVSVITNT